MFLHKVLCNDISHATFQNHYQRVQTKKRRRHFLCSTDAMGMSMEPLFQSPFFYMYFTNLFPSTRPILSPSKLKNKPSPIWDDRCVNSEGLDLTEIPN